MQVDTPFGQRLRHRRMRPQVVKLLDHVLTHHVVHPCPVRCVRTGQTDPPGAAGMFEPLFDGGHVVQALAGGHGRHGPAIGMATDHDVAHLEPRHRVFDAGGHAAWLHRVGRDDIAGVADHEQLPGLALCQQRRHDAAVRTRDEQRLGILLRGQVLEQRRPLREFFPLELQNALDQIFHADAPIVTGWLQHGGEQLLGQRPVYYPRHWQHQ
jgi:hypothetical protein